MKFLSLLKKLANMSDHTQHRMSCIIAKGNRPISFGHNKVKSSPRAKNRYNMLHAEVVALLSTPYEETKGCTAYIYRTTKNGVLAMAKPCEGCELALKLAGIKKVIYSNENNWVEENY